MPLTVGSPLSHYDVTAKIGEGGMGQVWRRAWLVFRRRFDMSAQNLKYGGQSQAVDATKRLNTSDGFIHPNVCRGRLLSWRATAFNSVRV